MKQFFYLISFLFISSILQAQTDEVGDIYEIWTYPVVYNHNEEVSWYFDLSGTGFSEDEDVYIWIWSPSEPDAGNWENSSEFAKLTYIGNFVWKFDLIPTEYFGMTPSDINSSPGYWLRLKDKLGTKMSTVSNIPYIDFSSFYTSNELTKSYPNEPILDRPLSILFNSNLVSEFENATSVHLHSGLNYWDIVQEYQSWVPAIVEKTRLKELGNGFYKMDLIPSEYFETPDGYVMENMNYLFVKDDWAATIPDQILFAADVVPPPPPIFSFFPIKISHKDFLGLSRTNNEPGINTLFYEITADGVFIEGEFEGNTTLITGFIDLVTALQGRSDLESIHVVVTDNNDRLISEQDIQLVQLD
jgi:hypothetical protein